ncbi:MAG TPA: histidine phosphatase family protein [Ramlibacter sp.]|jgi:phosphohistidine phosphatase SixA|nr:histidine phosphatase family protein [Ramlibacter sp.]
MGRIGIFFRALVAATWIAVVPGPGGAAQLAAVAPDSAAGRQLVERLRSGGLVLYFRHADTRGEACDRSFQVGDRPGQRNLSPAGRRQAAQIGPALQALGIPVQKPVLAGPVYRARDTAELAFGPEHVQVTDSLLADDYAGGRLAWVLAEHRRLMQEPVPAGTNRVLVGHRTPAIQVMGNAVGGRALPEGAAVVIEPGASGPRPIGILAPVPTVGSGFHDCG